MNQKNTKIKSSFSTFLAAALSHLTQKGLALSFFALIGVGCGQNQIQKTLHPDSFNCQNRVVDRLNVKLALKKPFTKNLLVRINDQTVIDECKNIKRADFSISNSLLQIQADGELSNNDPTIEIFETECNPSLPNVLRAAMGPQKAFAKYASYQKTTGATCSDPQLTHQFEMNE